MSTYRVYFETYVEVEANSYEEASDIALNPDNNFNDELLKNMNYSGDIEKLDQYKNL